MSNFVTGYLEMDTRALVRDYAAAAFSNDERKHALADIGGRRQGTAGEQ